MKLSHELCDEMFKHFPLQVKRWIVLFEAELRSAKKKHPNWPKDQIHRAAIVNEEAGELLRASIQHTYEKAPFYCMHEEAIQTGAMALRFLLETGELPKHKNDHA